LVVVKSWREEARFTPKQNQALDLCVNHPNAIVLYGGAGYGGKSHLLRWAGPFFNGRLRAAGFPGQTGVLFSSSYKALADRQMGKLQEELGHIGEIVTDKAYGLCFRFFDPSMGRIALRNLDKPDKYRSAEFAWALFEELTEIEFATFSQAIYSVRSSKGLPFLPILCASNPDGIGHIFVKTLFVPGYQDLSMYEGYEKDRIFFVQALPQDNPTWETNPQVQATLKSLPEHLRNARLLGNWDAPEGARWPVLNKYTHLFKMSEKFPQGLPNAYPLLMGIDYGLRAPYCCLWAAIDADKNAWVFREDYQTGFTADQQAERMVMLTGKNERIARMFADPACWAVFPAHEGYTDESPAKAYQERFAKEGERFGPLDKGFNRSRMIALNTLDRFFDQNNGHPNVYIEESCKNLWRELTGAIWDERGMLSGKKEDIDPRNPDHGITALYYMLHTYYEGPELVTADISAEQSHQIKLQEIHEQDLRDVERRIRLSGF
jgi:hypothetical protein